MVGVVSTGTKKPITIGSFYLYSERDMYRSAHHHRELIHAIEVGSEEYAKEVMSVHLRAAYHAFMANRKNSIAKEKSDES